MSPCAGDGGAGSALDQDGDAGTESSGCAKGHSGGGGGGGSGYIIVKVPVDTQSPNFAPPALVR